MVLPMEIEKLHFKASSGKVIDTIMMSVDLPLLDHFFFSEFLPNARNEVARGAARRGLA